jgi:hypothetical protein
MANKKVLELSSYSSVLSTDYIVIDRTAGTGNAQLSAVAGYVLSLPMTASAIKDYIVTAPKLSASIVNPYGGLKVDPISGLSVETKIHPDITASSTLGLSAANRIVGINSANSVIITVPAESTTNYDIGTNIVIYQKGVGQVTLVGASGVTILSNSNKIKLTGQYSSAALFKLASNSWLLGGDLTA